MKKIYAIVFLFFISGFVSSKEVGQSVACRVAKNFYGFSTHRLVGDNSVSLVYECKASSDEPVYYVYNISGNSGFIIVSADDLVQPVLGYSSTGAYNPADVPPPVQAWLKGYEKQIVYVREHNVSTSAEIAEKWNNYYSNTFPESSGARIHSVNPLCQTQWNQAPNENGMCPFDQAAGQHCVTGCPATAMAQIMKYWDYPAQGTGNHSYNEQHWGTLSANFGGTTYDWAGMPNVLTSPNNAVALLMFHCGVAVEMDYTVQGSGAYVCIDASPVPACSERAYKDYFGYDPNTVQGKLRQNFTDAAWISLIKTDLDASQPVQYAGFGGGGGHTWVCDGYDQNNFFHMNWGWGGNSDGYFSLDNLDPGSLGAGGGTGGFNNNQQAVVGIKPLNGGGGGGGGGTINQDGIALHALITVNANPIEVGTPLTVYTEVQNAGAADFTGDFAAVLFNSDGIFAGFVQEYTNQTLNAGFYYTAQFDLASIDVIPGLYYIGIYYKDGNNDYSIMDPSTFSNPVTINVTGPYTDIQMSGNTTVTPPNPPEIYVGDVLNIVTHVGNASGFDFSGYVSADLHSLDGSWLFTLDEIPVNLLSGNSYQLSFTSAALGVNPGNYYIAFWYTPDQSNYGLVYNGSFPNPIEITVVNEGLSPDNFENDNSEATAHVFPVNFVGNNADVVTTGSNMHLATDLDYYKIVLPSGNGYVITASAFDSYYTGGGTYTNDVQWSCSIDGGTTYSTTFDDVYNGAILVPNGGSVIFFVSDYFAGSTGTYQLNIHIVKGPISVEEIDRTSLRLYPNPARNEFSIGAKDLFGSYELKIFNGLGAMVMESEGFAEHRDIITDTRLLPVGFYDVMLTTDKGIFSSRLIIE